MKQQKQLKKNFITIRITDAHRQVIDDANIKISDYIRTLLDEFARTRQCPTCGSKISKKRFVEHIVKPDALLPSD